MKRCLIFIFAILLTHTTIAQTCFDTIPVSSPDSRFIVVGDEVTDNETRLIWKRCSLGQSGSDCLGDYANGYDWQQALQAAESERTDTGKSWRLPNIKELESIVEESCSYPAINLAIFPNTISYAYWSASTVNYDTIRAWGVVFRYGELFSGKKSSVGGHVRLVRDAP